VWGPTPEWRDGGAGGWLSSSQVGGGERCVTEAGARALSHVWQASAPLWSPASLFPMRQSQPSQMLSPDP